MGNSFAEEFIEHLESLDPAVRSGLVSFYKEKMERLEKETEHIFREIDKIQNSFLMKIHGSYLWFIFPWTSFIYKKNKKKIEKIKEENKEILDEYKQAKELYLLHM